jgi:hypothetical protein
VLDRVPPESRIGCRQEPDVSNVLGVVPALGEHSRQRGRQLGINEEAPPLGAEYGVSGLRRRVLQACLDVIRL